MNAIRRGVMQALVVTALIFSSTFFSAPVQAGPDHVMVYSNGRHAGYVVTWNRGGRRELSPYLREYGWYAPGHYYNHPSGYRSVSDNYEYGPVAGTGARLWCPEMDMYVVDETYCPVPDEEYYDELENEDERSYDGYRRHRRLYQER
jgi:hypothetical protein